MPWPTTGVLAAALACEEGPAGLEVGLRWGDLQEGSVTAALTRAVHTVSFVTPILFYITVPS